MALIEFENEDKYFVKFFLLDATLNLNNWGVTQKSLEANLESFIGKPFVLTPEFNHPSATDGDNLLVEQEKFRVGDIIKVGIEPRTGKAYGVAEITNENAKDILKNGEVSFVSPSIVFNNNDELDIHGNAIIESWEGAHVAAVKEPAYTVNKAQIKGKCAGSEGSCMTSLSKVEASLKNYEKATCNCKEAGHPEDNLPNVKSKGKDPNDKPKNKKKNNKGIPQKRFKKVVDFIDDFVTKNDELPEVDHIATELNVPEDQAEHIRKSYSGIVMEVTTKNKKKIIMPKKTENSSHKLKKSKNANNMKSKYAEEKDKDEAENEEEHVKAEDMSNPEEKRFDEEMKKGRKAEDEDKDDEEAEDENKLDLTDRQEEFLKDKKESSLRAEIKVLKSELRAMKANFRKAQIEPVIDSILEAKSKLGKINAEAEYNKLIRLDNETLASLKADYEKLSENISTPRFEVKYASVDSKAGDEILKRIRGGFN
jgi:hypothetical protein